VVAGTPLLPLGWAALLAPLTASRTATPAAREALAEAEDALGGVPTRRYGWKDMRRQDHARPGRAGRSHGKPVKSSRRRPLRPSVVTRQ
jgi:hypothetical protein